MDERSDTNKTEEVMLPGFRFHPTDEELVGFYLKRKVQQRPLSIELIKQLDIYKYDPWDLPKLATTGEKEWYFYSPRDRKYRNSTRPNRVTGAGFWKATGTDRPIYSSEGGSKCIGLKKSLVFYKGRAAKGIKTDWMMHEFRLPPLTDSASHKRFIDKNIPANDSWAICRIFKKTNSTTQRAISHSWVYPLPETTTTSQYETLSQGPNSNFTSENMTLMTSKSTLPFQFSSNSNDLQQSCMTTTTFSPLYVPSYKPINHIPSKPPPQVSFSNGDLPTSYTTIDSSSMFPNMSLNIFGDFGKLASESLDFNVLQRQGGNLSFVLPQEMQEKAIHGEDMGLIRDLNGAHFDDQWGNMNMRSIGNSFGLPLGVTEAWKSNLLWDSSSPCPSDQMSTSYSTNKCYT
ncbi:NAC (No Apical Meristem) domain transcriptional regulator superfamily protein [Actinidia rufa]|uniref:NAC (No Apical Meristem) domain transcriptional regulator superfamily protein n=1 Tax=Actinidia rufa TaxID=165716 RepID=A0A7J0EPM6_9ERIC|nr:NAC (No Apical Meristem) domain transcriptional regulator superfamily protein [Actinidia rufa]